MTKSATKDETITKADLKSALEQNDEEWQRRMLLLVMIMIIAVIGLD